MDWTGLVESLRVGDLSARHRLVSALAALLDLYCEQIAPDLSQRERELVVDQALLDVVEKIHTFDPSVATLPTWARGFVRIGVLRSRSGAREIPTQHQPLIEELERTRLRDERFYSLDLADADEKQIFSERGAALEVILGKLKPAEIDLLHARAIECLTFAQISDRLGGALSPAALRKRYQRLRQKVLDLAKNDHVLCELVDRTTG